MADIAVKVIVDHTHLGETERVRCQAEALGMKVEDVFPEIGAIYGRASENLVSELSQIDGVAEAEAEDTVQLPPLDEKVPQ